MLRDTENYDDVSGKWYNQWPLNTLVDDLILTLRREEYLQMLVNEPEEYSALEQDEASTEVLLHKHE